MRGCRAAFRTGRAAPGALSLLTEPGEGEVYVCRIRGADAHRHLVRHKSIDALAAPSTQTLSISTPLSGARRRKGGGFQVQARTSSADGGASASTGIASTIGSCQPPRAQL